MSQAAKETPASKIVCEDCGKGYASQQGLTKHKCVQKKNPIHIPLTPAPETPANPDPETPVTSAPTVPAINEQDRAELNAENDLMEELVKELEFLEELKELTQNENEPEKEDEIKKDLLEKIDRFKTITERKTKYIQDLREDQKRLKNEVECSKQVENNLTEDVKAKEKEIDTLKKEMKNEKENSNSILNEAKNKKKAAKDLHKEVQQLKSVIDLRDKQINDNNTYIKSLEAKTNAAENTDSESEQDESNETSTSRVLMDKETAGNYCVMCKRKFTTNSGLDKHMNAKHESKECPLCDEMFSNKVELVNHINFCMDRNGTSSVHVKCHKCNKNFNRDGLRRHNENGGCKQLKKTIVCNKCDAICTSVPDLRAHITEDHGYEKSKEVCRHWRAGKCFRGESCVFSHVGHQTFSGPTRSAATGTTKPCRNGRDCVWLARGKCHFRHQGEGSQDAGEIQNRQSDKQGRREQICWYDENCKRNPCPFKHQSLSDFPNLNKNQNPRIQVWNNTNQ